MEFAEANSTLLAFMRSRAHAGRAGREWDVPAHGGLGILIPFIRARPIQP